MVLSPANCQSGNTVRPPTVYVYSLRAEASCWTAAAGFLRSGVRRDGSLHVLLSRGDPGMLVPESALFRGQIRLPIMRGPGLGMVPHEAKDTSTARSRDQVGNRPVQADQAAAS
jgi:hypothetical protein